MSTVDVTAKTLFERLTSFTTKNPKLNEYFKNHQTTEIPEDLIILSQEDEDEVQLEDPSEIMRDDVTTTDIPETTNDITEICEQLPEEERFEVPYETMDVDMGELPNEEEPDIQVPPPFQVDITEKTINETVNESANDSSAKDTEDEEAEPEKNDAQDKRWTKRTQQTLSLLDRTMKKKPGPVNFKDLTKKCNRKQAAYKFYTLLTLSKEKCIQVQQDGLFAEILINPGERFNSYS